jgi:hypothetical protein
MLSINRSWVCAGIGKLSAAGLLAFGLIVGSATNVSATELDCTTGCNTTYAGALWQTVNQASTGTGVIDSFVRLSSNDNVVDGHNTSGTRLNDELAGHSFDRQLGDVPILNINGTLYYEFLLDINQESNDPLLVLNNVQICLASSGGLSATNTCPGTLTYQMGTVGGGDGTGINLNYNLNSGSGSGDLFMYIPVSTLGTNLTDYVYLYSQFGALTGYENNDGFEEWAVRVCGETYGKKGKDPGFVLTCEEPPVVPEPGTLLMLGSGLFAIAYLARRRRT